MEEAQESIYGRISLELPSDPSTVSLCRRVLCSFLEDLSIDAARRDDIELAISEATGNVVRHAYDCPGHPYRVTLILHGDHVRLEVLDQGVGFNRADVPEPDTVELGGRGLWLIEQLADATTVRTLPGGGCCLEAEFRLLRPLSLPSLGDTTAPAWPALERPAGRRSEGTVGSG
jgi:anti-sigma regulatory factor (Ser/Thr protein kinase)